MTGATTAPRTPGDNPSPITSNRILPEDRSRPSAGELVAIVALAWLPVAVPLIGQGPAQQRCAIALVSVGLVIAWAALSWPRSFIGGVIVAAASVGVVVTTGPVIGRTPAVIGLSAAAVGLSALLPTRGKRTRGQATPAALIPLAVAGVVWPATTMLVPALALHAVAGAIVAATLLAWPVPRSVHRAGQGVAAVLNSFDRAVGNMVGALGRVRQSVTRRFGMTVTALHRRWTGLSVATRASFPLGLLAALVTAPMFWRIAVDQSVMIRGTNDINSGMPRIEALSLSPLRLTVAHPVYFVLVRIMMFVLSGPVATTLVSTVAVAATVVVLVAWGRSRWDDRPTLSTGLALAFGVSYLLLESAAVLVPRTAGILGRFPAASEHARGPGYIALHQWATPTIVMATPLFILNFLLLLRVVDDAAETDRWAKRRRWMLGLLTFWVSMIMPATTLALAPAMLCYLVITGRVRGPAVGTWFRWFALPGAAVVVFQVLFLSSKVSDYEQAEWLWRPFWVWEYFGLDRPVLYLIYLFVPVCLWAGGQRYLRDPAVAVSAIGVVIGVIPFLLLEQTTVASVPDGDLGVPPLLALWLFVLSSIRFLLLEVQAVLAVPKPERPRWLPIAALVFGVMLIAGVVDLLSGVGLIQET